MGPRFPSFTQGAWGLNLVSLLPEEAIKTLEEQSGKRQLSVSTEIMQDLAEKGLAANL